MILKCRCDKLKMHLKKGTSELLSWKQLIMAEKMRESHRQLSEFQCHHKYLMVLCCHLSEGRRQFSRACFFKLRRCNGHFLAEPGLVLNQTHFHNLDFEIHYFTSVSSHRVRGDRSNHRNNASAKAGFAALHWRTCSVTAEPMCCGATLAWWIWISKRLIKQSESHTDQAPKKRT